MTSFTLSCAADGPLVRVQVGFTSAYTQDLRRSSRPVLAPIELTALLDTGADVSVIEQGLLTPFVREGMKLEAIVAMNAPGLGGLGYYPQFMVGFRIVHPSGTRNLDFVEDATEFVERPLGVTAYQAFIGRDILSRCIFTFDGPANTFSLTY
jgi:Retroviral aspartyl protease